jgi:hypothetical protein
LRGRRAPRKRRSEGRRGPRARFFTVEFEVLGLEADVLDELLEFGHGHLHRVLGRLAAGGALRVVGENALQLAEDGLRHVVKARGGGR